MITTEWLESVGCVTRVAINMSSGWQYLTASDLRDRIIAVNAGHEWQKSNMWFDHPDYKPRFRVKAVSVGAQKPKPIDKDHRRRFPHDNVLKPYALCSKATTK